MASVRLWVFQLVQVWIVHSFIELLLCETIRLGLQFHSPEFMAGLVTHIGFAVNGLTGIGIQRSPIGRARSTCVDLRTDSLT